MKKLILTAFFISALAFAGFAQSTDETAAPKVQTEQSQDTPAVTSGGQNVTKSGCGGGEAKSCCKSKKGKETAMADKKACCSDGKKSDAKKDDKNEHSEEHQH